MKKNMNIFNVFVKILISILMVVLITQGLGGVKALNGATSGGDTSSDDTSSGGGTAPGGTTISTPGDIINNGKAFVDSGREQVDSNQLEESVFNNLKVVGQVLVAIGASVFLVVGIVMSIKWITATPDKQAKLKQQLIGFVVSGVVIFGAVGIWNLAKSIMESLPI